MISQSTRAIIEVAMQNESEIPRETRAAILRLLNGEPEKVKLINSRRACEILECCKPTLWQYVKQGKLHEVRQSKRRIRYNLKEVEELAYRGIGKK